MHYDVICCCGHTAGLDTFGPEIRRQEAVKEKSRGLCPSCEAEIARQAAIAFRRHCERSHRPGKEDCPHIVLDLAGGSFRSLAGNEYVRGPGQILIDELILKEGKYFPMSETDRAVISSRLAVIEVVQNHVYGARPEDWLQKDDLAFVREAENQMSFHDACEALMEKICEDTDYCEPGEGPEATADDVTRHALREIRAYNRFLEEKSAVA